MSADDARLSIAETPARARSIPALDRRRVAGALAVLAWLGFAIGLHPLTLPEEGRYVGVAWEMLRSGHWLVPTQDGLPFFHKPPLFYWLTVLSMKLFGPSIAAARFAPLLAACVGAFAVHAVTRRRAGASVADAALVVLATLPFFFAAAQFANLDMLVAACVALAIVFAADAALALEHDEPHRRSLVLAWACAALAVLAKGLIGLVLPGLVVVVWLIVSRRARAIARLVSPLGVAVFLLIAAPWFVAVQQRYPGFARYFFVHHHFERFAASGFNNAAPWWFFLAALPVLTLPWSLWLARSRSVRAQPVSAERSAWRTLMWVWLATVVVFFSLPESKPVGYVMPALFPLAFLVAEPALAAWQSGRAALRRSVGASLGVAVAICVGAVVFAATRYDRDNTALARALLAARAPVDPVVFVDEYFFDIPFHARLAEPVPVIADWSSAKVAERDNWRRELAEAAQFAPQRAAAVLVSAARGFALRCGNAPLWVVVKSADEPIVARQPDALRIAASKRASLWRLAPQSCAGLGTPASAAPR